MLLFDTSSFVNDSMGGRVYDAIPATKKKKQTTKASVNIFLFFVFVFFVVKIFFLSIITHNY